MIDYVARALAQKALASSGGGTTIDTYSKDEIIALLNEQTLLLENKIKELENELNNVLVVSD